MVNRFSPPFTGLGTLASAQLSALLSSTPEIQMEEMVPFGTSHAGSKKQGMPLPRSWGEAPTTAEAPKTTLPDYCRKVWRLFTTRAIPSPNPHPYQKE